MGAAFGAATVDRLIGSGLSAGFFSNMAFRLATLFDGAISDSGWSQYLRLPLD